MDELSDKKTFSSIKSAKTSKSSNGSKRTRASKNSQKADIESVDISLSQLELMANKKKLNKPDEISMDISKKEQTEDDIKKSSRTKTVSSDSSSSSSSLDNTRDRRRKERYVMKENKNDLIRKEKSELLFKFNKLNIKGQWSSLRLDMNSSLDEIKNEYERVRNEIQTERSVAFFKRMLLLGVQGIEMMNNKFDPLGVDLDGWSEAMGYSMENQEYDEVMAELYEKYKGRGQMSPELRLIFMIISSATMFTISKRITKMDSNNAFKSFIGGLMGQQTAQQSQQQYYQQPQQQYQPQQNYYQQQNIPNPNELRNDMTTETTDDNIPSRMNGPNSKYINGDDIDINNILKTMNERKLEKERQEREQTELSDDILKNIPINKQKRKGRPKKVNNGMRAM